MELMISPLQLWQICRFGDDEAAQIAIAYYRARGWRVDDRSMDDEVETRIYSFMNGYLAARK